VVSPAPVMAQVMMTSLFMLVALNNLLIC